MTRIRYAALCSMVSLWVAAPALAQEGKTKGAGDGHWPQFRGVHASGVADGPAPTTWNGETGENIKWKTPIPGLGHSSPIIWGDRLFVTTAISGKKDPELKVGLYGNIEPVEDDTKHSFRIYCLDKGTGKILWEKESYKGVPKIKRHTKATHANSTPATDGKHVVAFFGSEGLYCYTVDGELKWKKNLGVLDAGYYVVPAAQWEYASSPVIYRDKVLVQCDVQKDSFLAALSIEDGQELWRTAREEVPTWSTPAVHEGEGRTQMIVNGYKQIGGFDLETGKLLWSMKGLGDIPVPTPIIAHDLIYVTNAHGGGAPIYAIRTNATGDISLAEGESANSHIAWSYARRGNYMQTPLVYGERLYMCRDNGVATCFDAKSGKKLYNVRLAKGTSGYTASPVAADGKVYFTSEDGTIHVVADGRKFKRLAVNTMGEVCMATPAISDGHLFVRGAKHVFCVGE